GTGLVSSDIRQVNLCLLCRRKLDLGLFSSLFETLQRQDVLGQIDTAVFFELFDDVVNNALVKVFAPQKGIPTGRQNLELLFTVNISDFDNGNIKSTPAQVINGNLAVSVRNLVQAKSQCGSGRFVDDALDLETGNLTGIFGGLTLTVIKVRGDGTHGLSNGFTQVVLGGLLHLAQNIYGNLLWCQCLALCLYPRIIVVCLDNFIRHELDVLLDLGLFETAADQT